ncbi:hypothetical protein CVD28_01770 [Bacillus sp. M6-12]|nr:hypothetical protein CVD28_01770 [Bacillus sp. M6-12]
MNFNNYELLKQKLDVLLSQKEDVEIVSAKAKGADLLGERYAKERHLKLQSEPPNWKKYGDTAWVVRNQEMAEYADALVAFWDRKSRGTKNMIDLATQHNLEIRVIYY